MLYKSIFYLDCFFPSMKCIDLLFMCLYSGNSFRNPINACIMNRPSQVNGPVFVDVGQILSAFGELCKHFDIIIAISECMATTRDHHDKQWKRSGEAINSVLLIYEHITCFVCSIWFDTNFPSMSIKNFHLSLEQLQDWPSESEVRLTHMCFLNTCIRNEPSMNHLYSFYVYFCIW